MRNDLFQFVILVILRKLENIMKGILIVLFLCVLCSCEESHKIQTIVETYPTIDVTDPERQLSCWNLKNQGENSRALKKSP